MVSIQEALRLAIRRAATTLPQDVLSALEQARARETSSLAADQLDAVLENIAIASRKGVPLCQDTGVQTFFVQVGVDNPFLKELKTWIVEAVREATATVPLRPNTVDPFTAHNPGDNTGHSMPFVHWDLIDGPDVIITLLPKGGGSENMSALRMLSPTAGMNDIKKSVVEHIASCRGWPCPPTILGIGLGGGADIALELGKKAVLRAIGSSNPIPEAARLEQELLALVNRTGIGAMGIGGDTTCLAVHVEVAHRHPASFPLGIVVQCWANRRSRVVLHADGSAEVID